MYRQDDRKGHRRLCEWLIEVYTFNARSYTIFFIILFDNSVLIKSSSLLSITQCSPKDCIPFRMNKMNWIIHEQQTDLYGLIVSPFGLRSTPAGMLTNAH